MLPTPGESDCEDEPLEWEAEAPADKRSRAPQKESYQGKFSWEGDVAARQGMVAAEPVSRDDPDAQVQ